MGESNGNGAPMWVRALDRYGVVAAIALFLVWFLTSGLTNDITAMRREHRDLRFYLRAICLNTASTAAQQAQCAPPVERED
jgi:hypothetical protein